MAIRGKSISMFLMDGDANGRIKCSLTNWTGVAYKIPRIELDKCKNISHLKQSGVYFLFGTSVGSDDEVVYVGQARARKNGRGLLCRVKESHLSIDYWTEAVILTTRDDYFGPTEISYLENRFCNLAKETGRYIVVNGNEPSIGNMTEEKECEMEEFIDYAKVVIGALGYKVFTPILPKIKLSSKNIEPIDLDEPTLYMEYSGAKAIGKRASEGFVVLKGSLIMSKTVKSCPENAIRYRKKYADKIDDSFKILDDLLFTSPSAAAAFVGGASLSGNVLWHTTDGITLKQLEGRE